MTKTRDRWIALLIAGPGVVVCLVSIAGFFGTMSENDLPEIQRPFFQEHYLAVGRAYSQAFAVGFFLCFFLMIAAIAIGTAVEERRRAKATEATEATPDSRPRGNTTPFRSDRRAGRSR